ncbi:MAG: 50S ribosomal protein L21 [Patescibacteria group bacterium]|jgi:large subunit ribosomal protein L21
MKAVIKTGGKQYLVSEGDVLVIEKLPEEAGAKITLSDVLLVSDDEGKDVKLGTPVLEGAKVEAEVVEQVKADKIRVFKMKRRKNYRKTIGHRQKLTQIKIISITA